MAPQSPTCQICGGPLGCGVGGKPPIICFGHAAVPELIAACKEAYERIAGNAKDGNLGWHEDHPLVRQLYAAIEKAEGRENGEGEG